MFLVLNRYMSEDFPIGLFSTYSEALDFANKCPREINKKLKRMFHTDPSEYCSIWIVEFYGHLPCNAMMVRDTAMENDNEAIEADKVITTGSTTPPTARSVG